MHPALALVALPLLAPTPWVWPVAPPHSILRGFVAAESPYAAGHRGIDLVAVDSLVYAPADGIVHFAGTVVDRPVLSVAHAGGVLTSYEPVVTPLSAGDVVARGQVLGEVVAGHCSPACLHFGVRVNGQYVSPLAWLEGIGRAVLLPTRSAMVSARAAPNARAPAHGREPRIRVNSRKSTWASAHPFRRGRGTR